MNNIWIDFEFKDQYFDSSKKGIRLHFNKDVNEIVKKECINFCNWLRKRYWFPIRCNIYFKNQIKFRSQTPKLFCSAIFYPGDDIKKTFPSIYIACGKFNKLIDNEEKNEELIYYYFCIVHELTHYFQWYFFEDEKRSNRSLEYGATQWAKALITEWEINRK